MEFILKGVSGMGNEDRLGYYFAHTGFYDFLPVAPVKGGRAGVGKALLVLLRIQRYRGLELGCT